MPRDRDEGPSAEDIRRYGVDAPSSESAVIYCPDCSAPMHPDADICPKCFCFIDGDRLRRPHKSKRAKEARAKIIILLLLISLLLPLIAWLRWW